MTLTSRDQLIVYASKLILSAQAFAARNNVKSRKIVYRNIRRFFKKPKVQHLYLRKYLDFDLPVCVEIPDRWSKEELFLLSLTISIIK
jgi:hypothetical protein